MNMLISPALPIVRTCLCVLQSRQVFLGLCLPQSCGPVDITALLQPSGALQVLRVRPVPGDYSLLADTKFHILG
jgi:hypothetical protein